MNTEDTATSPALVADPTVEATRVSKWFGHKVAVSDVTCSFGPGVTGLLGPNGAGKTTLLRMLAGLMSPAEGAVRVLGTEPRSTLEAYREVGYVPEEDAVYPFLTGREFVRYAAVLSGLQDADTAALGALELVGMTAAADRAIGGYSKGMRQRTKVAAALIHEPSVLILDEPLNGTDPVQRAHLISLFRDLGRKGRTVIVSSHILEEVQRMADRVLAIVDGKLAAAGDIAAIRRAMADIPYRVRVAASPTRALATALMATDAADGVRLEDGVLHVETDDLAELGRIVPLVAHQSGIRVSEFQPEDESLESIFRYLVRRR